MGKTKKAGKGKSKTDRQRMRKAYLTKKYKLGTITEAEIEELTQTKQDIKDYHAAPFKTVENR